MVHPFLCVEGDMLFYIKPIDKMSTKEGFPSEGKPYGCVLLLYGLQQTAYFQSTICLYNLNIFSIVDIVIV